MCGCHGVEGVNKVVQVGPHITPQGIGLITKPAGVIIIDTLDHTHCALIHEIIA